MTGRLRGLWQRLRRRYWVSLTLDVLLIVAALWAIHAWNTRSLPHGDARPGLSLRLLDGPAEYVDLPEQGPGVIYFFAPWCGYCRRSIGHLDGLVRDGDVAWARAVALDYGNADEVRKFVSDTGLRQPVLLGDGGVAGAWNIRAFPTYFVIGRDGRIESRSVGYATRLGLELRAWLAR